MITKTKVNCFIFAIVCSAAIAPAVQAADARARVGRLIEPHPPIWESFTPPPRDLVTSRGSRTTTSCADAGRDDQRADVTAPNQEALEDVETPNVPCSIVLTRDGKCLFYVSHSKGEDFRELSEGRRLSKVRKGKLFSRKTEDGVYVHTAYVFSKRFCMVLVDMHQDFTEMSEVLSFLENTLNPSTPAEQTAGERLKNLDSLLGKRFPYVNLLIIYPDMRKQTISLLGRGFSIESRKKYGDEFVCFPPEHVEPSRTSSFLEIERGEHPNLEIFVLNTALARACAADEGERSMLKRVNASLNAGLSTKAKAENILVEGLNRDLSAHAIVMGIMNLWEDEFYPEGRGNLWIGNIT